MGKNAVSVLFHDVAGLRDEPARGAVGEGFGFAGIAFVAVVGVPGVGRAE